MMKRILCLIAAFLFVLPVASAAYKDQINRDEHVLQSTDIALGGLMVGTTRAQVEAIYGAPTARTEPKRSIALDEMMDEYTYGTSFKVIFVKDTVMYLNTNAHNGIATPAGVTVGMDASILQKIYGTGEVDPTKHKARRMPGYDYYTYWQAGDPLHYLTFAVKDGKIAYIKVGLMQR